MPIREQTQFRTGDLKGKPQAREGSVSTRYPLRRMLMQSAEENEPQKYGQTLRSSIVAATAERLDRLITRMDRKRCHCG